MDVDAVSKRSNIYGIIFIEWNYSHVSIQNVVEHSISRASIYLDTKIFTDWLSLTLWRKLSFFHIVDHNVEKSFRKRSH